MLGDGIHKSRRRCFWALGSACWEEHCLWLVLRGGLPSAEMVMTVSILFIYGNEKAASHIAIELLDAPIFPTSMSLSVIKIN